jgi:hypothetical protein
MGIQADRFGVGETGDGFSGRLMRRRSAPMTRSRSWGIAVWLALSSTAQAQVMRPDGSADFTRYHDAAETAAFLKQVEQKYPDLARIYVIGKSYKGQDLLLLELTNRKNKAPGEKPGYYIDGGVHSGELTGSEQVLYLIWHYASNYGKDPAVTELLDTRTLYLRPKFNPDGSDYSLKNPDNLRSTVRPWDEDGDGLLDEDKAEDLDGDGAITQMRVRSPNGTFKISKDDPRLMVPRGAGETGGEYYLVLSEGLDSDGDGSFNEDGVGGIDMNRNFPRSWALPYLQNGAGAFPLSENETRASLDFIVAHPNVTGIVHNHTAGGFLYRLPSTEPPESHEAEDLRIVRQFADRYTAITGHPSEDSYAGEGSSRHGTLISWGYFDFGVLGWVPEHWGGFGKDDNGDKRVTDAERLRWSDEELKGQGFAPWTVFKHPQLGEVGIGGWRRKFTQQNPPPSMLEAEIAMKVPWFTEMAMVSPLVAIKEAKATALGGGLFRVDLAVENGGYMPTNVTERAIVAKLAKPVRASLKLTMAALVDGKPTTSLGHIPGRRALSSASPQGNVRTHSWVLRAAAPGSEVEIEVVSEKGGTDRRTVALR